MTATTSGNEFIEASAGTGKTFSIVQSVVEMVAEGTPLGKILIVTFTEKATGELRRRIRSGLASARSAAAANGDKTQADSLRQAVDQMDDAAIYTIHGFCQRMLSEYAFESGQPFRQELLDDPQVWERLFARSLRGTWSRKILDHGSDPVRSADAYQKGFYQSAILKVAKSWMQGDSLHPAPTSILKNHRDTVEGIAHVLRQSSLPDRIEASKLKSMSHTVTALKKLAASLSALDGEPSIEQLRDILKWEATEATNKKLAILVEAKVITAAELEALEKLQRVGRELKAAVLSLAADDMNRRFARFKQSGGFIDFNDMLVLLRDALRQSQSIVDVLQSRFSCAVVDEFQDTDHVQWEIFRRAFLDSPSHRLIVVGDPKQAIYSFRGANIQAYTGARSKYLQGQVRALSTNYRSDPALLGALNRLFHPSGGWFPDDGGIRYEAVQAPSGELRARVFSDGSRRAPLNLVRLPEDVTGGEAREIFGRFVAQEIGHLLKSGVEIAHWDGPHLRKRPLTPADICLLIRTHGEASDLTQALRAAGIRYSTPRSESIFASDEALEWRYLLRAVAAPDDARALMKALLTRFFECSSEQLERVAELTPQHPLLQMVRGWHQRAQSREWSQMMRQIIEESGVLIRAMQGPDGDRIATNHQHLALLLLEQATRSGGQLADLIVYLDRQRSSGGGDRSGLQRLETEEPRVQIMTMHAAKGLEFPIVFIAGGFTSGHVQADFHSYTTPEGRVYSFGQDEDIKSRQKREHDEEMRRLYYVGLTRAQYKLYLPALAKKSNAPLAAFIKDALDSATAQPGWAANGEVTELAIAGDGVVTQIIAEGQTRLHDGAGVPDWTPPAPPDINSRNLKPPQVLAEWGQRRTSVASYSALTKQASRSAAPQPTYLASEDAPADMASEGVLSATATVPRADDEGEAPTENARSAASASGATGLPGGTATGSLLHEVLENVPPTLVLAAGEPADLLSEGSVARRIIEAKVRQHLPHREAKRASDLEQVAGVVWRALRTPMPFLGGDNLGSLSQCRHEVEFWLPTQHLGHGAAPEEATGAPGVRLQNSFLNGLIDLVFCHSGRYYVLDWKSNSQPDGDYSRPALEQMMQAARYDLQYKIYVLALDRMLRLSQPGYDPQRHLGGVCYLFLRGLQDASEDGIYFVETSELSIPKLEAEVQQQLTSWSRRTPHA